MKVFEIYYVLGVTFVEHMSVLVDIFISIIKVLLVVLISGCWGRFWWSLLVGVDWWDAVGCTQSAAEDSIGKNI